jgi:molybdopterin converting factor small subunit
LRFLAVVLCPPVVLDWCAMATVTLRAPLKDLAGGASELEMEGTTVGDVLRGVEAAHPKLEGWILDEQGRVRQHVNVFVNGERLKEDAPVAAGDRLHVLPSISGGCTT